MKMLLAVALGGALGSVARYWASLAVYQWLGKDFPYGTLAVNVAGGLLMGLLTELLVARFAVALEWRLLVLVGFLGGFTTFSTFSMDTWLLLSEGEFAKAALNALASVVLCVVAVWLGLHLARWGVAEEWHRWARMEAYGARLAMIAGLAYSFGLLGQELAGRWVWPVETQALLALLALTVLAPGGAWYLQRPTAGITEMLLAFAYSTALSGGGLWLGWWQRA
jgi:CrcB protein